MLAVRFKFLGTDLGRCLAAEILKEEKWAVCFAAFPKAKSEEESLMELYKLYPGANKSDTLQYEDEIINVLNGEPVPESLRVSLDGPTFYSTVWSALLKIPYGQVTSYADVARAIGNPKAYRAVAKACHENHIAVIVPCHRVVASNGLISGFGWGIENKKMLLAREGYTKYC